jgi:peptidoglycan/xylan/chitin deacetylase (PgdA/CDA1 family)
MKSGVLRLLTDDAMVPVLRPLQRGLVSIMMFHRFHDAETGLPGHDPAAVRANLAFLRRHRFDVVPLMELVTALREGRQPTRPTVVLTVDDGYGDYARIGAPIFAEFDCPSTLFVVTGFADGELWIWSDKILYAVMRTRRATVDVEVRGRTLHLDLRRREHRVRQGYRLIEALKRTPLVERDACIARLARVLDVELPTRTPAEFAAVSWDEVRHWAARGSTFGPHTVTHPILTQVSAEQSAREITESWRQLQARTPAAIPVFCYPNGDPPSISAREVQAATEAGLVASVTAVQGYARAADVCADGELGLGGSHEIPRFPFHDDPAQFRQIVTGVEYGKRAMRRALGVAQ